MTLVVRPWSYLLFTIIKKRNAYLDLGIERTFPFVFCYDAISPCDGESWRCGMNVVGTCS